MQVIFTFSLKEVERAEKASISTRRGFGAILTKELGELGPRKVYKPGYVTEHKLQERFGVLVAEFLNKKIWVEDDRRSDRTRGAGRLLTVGHHASEKETHDNQTGR